MSFRDPLAVAAGGAAGAVARVAFNQAFPVAEEVFPWPTLSENLLGALVLGIVIARLAENGPRWLVLLAATGFLGAFTTFAALAVQLERLLAVDQALVSFSYLVASLLGGIAAAAAGLRLGRARE